MENDNSQQFTIISTETEFNDYAELLFSDVSKALEKKVILSENLIQPIVFRIPSTDDKPFITYSWMKVFIKFQEDLYVMLEQILDRQLTAEEKKEIDIKVYIEKGSNLYEIVVDILKLFNSDFKGLIGDFKEMTVPQILAITVPVALYYGLKSYFSRNFDSKDKERDLEYREKELENNKLIKALENDNLDSERKAFLESQKIQNDNSLHALEVIEKVVDFKNSSESKTARIIKKMSDKEIEVNGKIVSKKDMDYFARRRPRQKPVEKQEKIIGNFLTEIISYKDEIPKISIKGIDSNGINREFKDLPVSAENITSDMHSVMDIGKPLHWEFTVTSKNDIPYFFLVNKIEVIENL